VKNLKYHARKLPDLCRSPCINRVTKPVGKWTTWGKNGHKRIIIIIQYALRTRDELMMLRIMFGSWLWYSD